MQPNGDGGGVGKLTEIGLVRLRRPQREVGPENESCRGTQGRFPKP